MAERKGSEQVGMINRAGIHQLWRTREVRERERALGSLSYDRSSTIYRVLYLLWIYSVFMKHQTSKWQKQPRDDEECYEE